MGQRFAGVRRRGGIAVLLAVLVALVSLPMLGGSAAAAGNGALLLNGSGQYASMGRAPALGLSTFTLEIRFRRDAAGVATSTGYGGISDAVPLLTKGRAEDDGSNVDSNWFLGISGSRGVLAADFEGAGNDYGNNHPVYGVTPVSSGVWHSAAATYDGSTWRLYLDGRLETSLPVGVQPRWDSIQWAAIGSALNSKGAPDGYFAGAVDEARVWNNARSAADIAATATTPVTTGPGLVGRWGFDETSGTTAADSSGSGVTATLVGGPQHVDGPGATSGGGGTTPSAPTGLSATPGDGRVTLTWAPNADTATVGYQVYRSTTLPVPTSGRPANPTLLTGTAFVDPNVVNGSAVNYVVVAVSSSGATSPPSSSASATPQASGDPVLVGAGDIASCYGTGDDQTARLLDATPGTVFTLGDNVYDNGTSTEFANCYDPTWGRAKVRTRPVAGNHDYNTSRAAGYYGYFGAAAGDPTKGWYSYDVGSWHVVVLNSECSKIGGCGVGSPEEVWLKADLAAHSSSNILAMWHEPRFDSYNGPDTRSSAFWNDLYAAGADLVLNGHSHLYERFAPQTPSGTRDDTRGIRQITVGSGGEDHHAFGGSGTTNSQVHDSTSFGVLKLTLRADSYSWQFLPVAGATFTDSGTAATHRSASAPDPDPVPAGPATPTAVTGSPSTAGTTLGWTSGEPSTTGFVVDRSTSASGPWTRLTSSPVSGRTYLDGTAPLGVTSYYQVRAVDSSGRQSAAATTSARRSFAVHGSTTASVYAGRSVSAAPPSGAVTGDILLATVTARGLPALTTPAGWTLIRKDVKGSVLTSWTFYQVVGSSPPPSTAWAFGGNANAVVGTTAIAGVDPASPVLTSAGRGSAKSSTIKAPSVSPAVAGSLLIGTFSTASRSTFTPPAGSLEELDVTVPTGSSPVSLSRADKVRPTTGSTGTWSAIASSPERYVAQTIALRPKS